MGDALGRGVGLPGSVSDRERVAESGKDHSAAANLGLIRRIALNLLHHNGPLRDSLRRGKRRATLNDDYRLRRFFGILSPTTT